MQRLTKTIATPLLPAIVALALGLLSQSAAGAEGEPRARLLEGFGVYSRPLSTDSVLAQRYFDQGLTLIYGYYFVQAVASFQEALRHDPDHPMLHWGLALAIGPNPNSRAARVPDDPQGEGAKAIQTALRHRSRASAREQALIDALAVRYDTAAYPERDARDVAYIEATRTLLRDHPDDLEGGFLLADAVMTRGAWSYWREDGTLLDDAEEAAGALERVMALHPLHPGANHLYIHLLEAEQPARAVAAADRLAALAPRAGHIVHMPSHIFIRVGRYEEAIATNERSAEVDRAVVKEWADLPYPEICTYNVDARKHAGHAYDFIRLARSFQGNHAEALRYAKRTAEVSPAFGGVMGSQRQIATVWLIQKFFGQWEALLAEPEPSAEYPFLGAMWSYARGSALANTGDLEGAQRALDAISAAIEIPALQEFLVRRNPAPTILRLARHSLDAEIALAQGRHNDAIASFGKAVAIEDRLEYVEPPDWPQPTRLFLGTALLEAGRPGEAEVVFRKELGRFPGLGWALLGLSQSLEAQGKSQEALSTGERFAEAWRESDVTPERPVFLAPARALSDRSSSTRP